MVDDDDWTPLADVTDRVVGGLVRRAWEVLRRPEKEVRRDAEAPTPDQFRGETPKEGGLPARTGSGIAPDRRRRVVAVLMRPPDR